MGTLPKLASGLSDLHEELELARQGMRKLIENAPDDLQAHRVYCLYAAKTMETYKTALQAMTLDRDKILIDALMSVVLVLNEKKENAAAETVGRYLEAIEQKAKEQWRQFGETSWPGETKRSGRSSSHPSAPSSKPGRKKKSKESKTPSTT